jgi:uncharacterized protein (TIGR00369 family)
MRPDRTTEFANADLELIHRFVRGDGRPLQMDSNSLARALSCGLLRVDLAKGIVEVEFEPDPLFIQGAGVLQGGAISAMLDFAMAFAVLARVPVGRSCSTVNMSTTFQLPAPQGHYRAVGEVDRCGKTMAFARAGLFRADTDNLVASATSTLVLTEVVRCVSALTAAKIAWRTYPHPRGGTSSSARPPLEVPRRSQWPACWPAKAMSSSAAGVPGG